MTRLLNLVPMIAFLSLTGCAGFAVEPRVDLTPTLPPFVEAEHQLYAKMGTASIKGEAFLRTRNGGVQKGAGCKVYLIPATVYGQAFWDEFVSRESMLRFVRQPLPAVDPKFRELVKTTTADSDGRFEFAAIPAGEYIVGCGIIWEVVKYGARMDRPHLSPTGTLASDKFTLKDGEDKKVVAH
jgi:hypothetical protein